MADPGTLAGKAHNWRGALFSAFCLVYGCMVVMCAAAHYLSAWARFPVLLGAVWLVVECWSVFLLVCACRYHLFQWAAKALGLSFLGSGGQQQMRRRTAKTSREGRGDWFTFASCEMQGWRERMEDAVVCSPKLEGGPEQAALFAVFDGHGGSEASSRAAELIEARVARRLAGEEAPGEALRQALREVEEDLRQHNTAAGHLRQAGRDGGRFDFVGSTAAVALLTRKTVTVVNVGDSRVFKCCNGECVPLTRDHKPESPRERRRIEAAGGTVVLFGPCYRVDCSLNLSRSLGDFRFKDPSLAPEDQKISPVGDVTVSEISPQDEFLVVACDGLFELMTWKSVCAYIRDRIHRMPLTQIAEGLLDECCSPNMIATCGRGTDNESVIIVKLQDP